MDVLFSIIKNKRFYAWFLTIMILYVVANYSNVRSSSWFTPRVTVENTVIWNRSFVPKKQINDLVLWITYSNVTNWDLNRDIGSKINVEDIASLVRFSQKIEIISNYDIYKSLKETTNRKYILDEHIKNLNDMYNQCQSMIPNMSNYIKNQQLEYTNCNNSKKQADTYYTQWIEKWDWALVDYGYRQATEYGDCETKQRITINAYTPIFEKIKNNYEKVKGQKEFIEKNYNLLVSNFELIESAQLDELLKLKK